MNADQIIGFEKKNSRPALAKNRNKMNQTRNMIAERRQQKALRGSRKKFALKMVKITFDEMVAMI